MTEDQYLTLCEYCDNILVSEDSTFERIAINWLHVIREHPVFLRQYEDIFLTVPVPAAKLFNYFQLAFLDYARTIRVTWQYFRSSKKKWCGNLPSGPPVDFVFVSHLLNSSQLTGEDDFYFGRVPAELMRRGKSVVIVLINHNDIPADDINHCLASSTIPRIVISNVLSPKAEFYIRERCSNEAKRLKQAASIEISDIRKKILSKASIEAMSPSTKTSLRIAEIVGEVIYHTRAKRIVTTYEGHSWERLIYATARKSSSGIFCIGYQHAALFRLQHAAKRSLGANFDPDKILCAGPVGLAQLKRSGFLPDAQLGVLGSSRCVSNLDCNGKSTFLVLPEGIAEECELLFEFSLSCAFAHPEIHFIWRLHPILPLDKLLREKGNLGHLPPNIEISTKSFNQDISRSSFVLYRGSTAVITAAANGAVPIYVERSGELTIDPLYEISNCHPTVNSTQEISAALNWTKWTDEAMKYCQKFYAPFNCDELTNC